MIKKAKNVKLAYRKYPEPDGTLFYKRDLKKENQVEMLFDYCQILEAIIFKEGWDFLIKKYGYEKLYQINIECGWLDSEDINEYKTDIESYINGLP